MIRTGKPDRKLSLRKYRAEAGGFDRGVATLGEAHEAIRQRAIAGLGLRSGDIVLDVGCGTGLSFPLLVAAVGLQGKVFGIDQSPEMLMHARALIEQERWRNVTLVNASAAEAEIGARAAAALFFYTHDIMREPAAIENILRQLKPDARIAAVGIKWARWWNVPANVMVWRRAQRFTTTLAGLRAPWEFLQASTAGLQWESLLGGAAYIAWSRLRNTTSGESNTIAAATSER